MARKKPNMLPNAPQYHCPRRTSFTVKRIAQRFIEPLVEPNKSKTEQAVDTIHVSTPMLSAVRIVLKKLPRTQQVAMFAKSNRPLLLGLISAVMLRHKENINLYKNVMGGK